MDKNAKPYSLDHLIHTARWRSLAYVYSERAKGRYSLDRKHLCSGWAPGFDPAGAVVLGAALRAWIQVHGRRSQQLDSLHRRRIRARHRRHFLPADHAHHAAGMDLYPLVLERDREPGQGVLHLVSGVADGN